MWYLRSGFQLELAAGTDPVLTSAPCAASQNGSYYHYQHLWWETYGSTPVGTNSFRNVSATLNDCAAF